MYALATKIASIKEYFTFNDCLLFGAIVSATDPGIFL